jgi:16S rRNA (cytidine1402-2'-O)-methyltransferase
MDHGTSMGERSRRRNEATHEEVSAGQDGALVLVGTPIGNLGDLAPRARDALRDADVIACEDTRRTRALLSALEIPAGNRLRSVHAHNENERAAHIVDEIAEGKRVAYVTDAGMPGISDPGAELVRACLRAGLSVDVVPGPTALTVALVLSGLPTERFVFDGFLPRKGTDRRTRLAALGSEPRTAVLYESPRRVAATLADLVVVCGPERPVAVVRELTKLYEEAYRGTLGEAAALAAGHESRGEHVIVLGGAPAGLVSDDTVADAVREALENGASARDAATAVAAELGVARRRAYEVALTLRKS